MAQRARDQYISIYEQPKKPDKPKTDPVIDAFVMIVLVIACVYFGFPLLDLAQGYWDCHPYRYYP